MAYVQKRRPILPDNVYRSTVINDVMEDIFENGVQRMNVYC